NNNTVGNCCLLVGFAMLLQLLQSKECVHGGNHCCNTEMMLELYIAEYSIDYGNWIRQACRLDNDSIETRNQTAIPLFVQIEQGGGQITPDATADATIAQHHGFLIDHIQ